ncbi:DEAD/DEAH box helicase, partial [archaeon]
ASTVFTAATGTGKTLAYLVPLMQRLKLEEQELGIVARPQRPRAIILVPTRELAVQVLAVVKRMCHVVKLRAVGVVGGSKQGSQRRDLDTPVDIVVATPGRLTMLHRQGYFFLSDARCVVLDEVDTLLDAEAGFLDEVMKILVPMGVCHPPAGARQPPRLDGDATPSQQHQIVLAGATIPAAAKRRIQSLFPSIPLVAAASAHRLADGITQKWVRVSGEPSAKYVHLLDACAHIGGDAAVLRPSHAAGDTAPPAVPRSAQAMLFCNTVASARASAHLLEERGFSVVSLHGDIPPGRRKEEVAAFICGQAQFLVCTDAAARGLDFPGLQHIVMVDFPLNPVEYLHRAGRVGRAGEKGHVVNLVTKRDVVLATAIQGAVAAAQPLATLSSHKDDYDTPHIPVPSPTPSSAGSRTAGGGSFRTSGARVSVRSPPRGGYVADARGGHASRSSTPRSDSREPHIPRTEHDARPRWRAARSGEREPPLPTHSVGVVPRRGAPQRGGSI